MRGEDDALAGFAQLQTIVDVVESNAKMGLVHSAHFKIVSATGDEAGGGNGAAFVGYAQEVKVTRIVEQPVRKGVRRAEVDAQNDPAVLNDPAREGQKRADRSDIWFCQTRQHLFQPILGACFDVIVQQAEHVAVEGRGRAIVEPGEVEWPFDPQNFHASTRKSGEIFQGVGIGAVIVNDEDVGVASRDSRADTFNAGPQKRKSVARRDDNRGLQAVD